MPMSISRFKKFAVTTVTKTFSFPPNYQPLGELLYHTSLFGGELLLFIELQIHFVKLIDNLLLQWTLLE